MNKLNLIIIMICILVIGAIISINVSPQTSQKTKRENNKKSEQSQVIKSTMKEKEEHYYPLNGLSETKDGFYFYSNTQRIIYVDKATMQATPLCFDPDCEHPYDESCSAYVRGIRNLQLYNGKLYADITESRDNNQNDYISIYEMELDGSNRKKIIEIFSMDDIRTKENEEEGLSYNYGLSWMILNDTIYVFYSYDNGKESKDIAKFYALKDGKKLGTIYEKKLNDISYNYGGYIYDEKENILYQDVIKFVETEQIIGDVQTSVTTMDTETRKLSLDSNQCEVLEETTKGVALFQNQLIYNGNGELQTYNRETKQFETYITLDEKFVVYSFSADDEYLYVQNSSSLDDGTEENPITMDDLYFCIYDKDKKLVDKVNVPNEHICPMGGKDAYIILAGNEFYYLDKSKIGTGELEFIKIEGVI